MHDVNIPPAKAPPITLRTTVYCLIVNPDKSTILLYYCLNQVYFGFKIVSNIQGLLLDSHKRTERECVNTKIMIDPLKLVGGPRRLR